MSNAAVLAISLQEPRPLVERLQEIGALGFVPKARIGSGLLPALETILQSGTWFKGIGEKSAYPRGAGQNESSPFAPECPVVAIVCIGFPASL
jgi:hypothetical protein